MACVHRCAAEPSVSLYTANSPTSPESSGMLVHLSSTISGRICETPSSSLAVHVRWRAVVLVEFPRRLALPGAFSQAANRKRRHAIEMNPTAVSHRPFASPTASASWSRLCVLFQTRREQTFRKQARSCSSPLPSYMHVP